MVPKSSVPVEIVRKEPIIWLSRLLLLESADPWRVIRSIDLHRGLNVVWSNDEKSDDGPHLTGHGVGKTVLCRLIRFCLGEPTYAHPSLAERIKGAHPSGWVAAEVHVNGRCWSLARPLGRGRSIAKSNGNIEELFAETRHPGSYDEFKGAVAESALQGLPSGPILGGNRSILWDHLLMWCARDQEARLQTLWEWRSPRSENESPVFQRPKQDPAIIVRASLGLLTDEESSLQTRIAEIERRQKDLSRRIDDRKREPEFWVRRIRAELKLVHQIEDADSASLNQSEVLSLPALIETRSERYAIEARSMEERLKDLDRRIVMIAARLNELEPFAAQHQAAVDATRVGSNITSSKIAQLEAEKESVELHLEGLCTYGNISFGECERHRTNPPSQLHPRNN